MKPTTVLTVLALCLSGVARAAVDIAPIQRLIDAQDYEQAYHAAAALSDAAAGDPAFDYLYGIAALESGRAHLAVYALSRVAMQQPTHRDARVALARAYDRLGQTAAARTVLASIGDEGETATGADTGAAHAPPTARAATRRAFTLTAALGHDSNVNATTDSEQLPQPPATVLALTPSARARSDEFLRIDVNGGIERDVGTRTVAFAQLGGYHNANRQEHEFDNTLIGIHAGGAYRHGANRTLLSGSYRRLWLDGAGYLAASAPTLAWQYALGARGRVDAGVTYAEYRYDEVGARDTDAIIVSLGWRNRFAIGAAPQLQVLAYGGDEDARNDRYEYVGRAYHGIQVRAAVRVAARHEPYFHGRWQQDDYRGIEPIYGAARADRYQRVGLGSRYRLAPGRYLGAEVEYTDNRSNVALYEFARTRAFVTTRLEWQ